MKGGSASVPLASHTTFGIGGPARFFIEVKTAEEAEEALVEARASGLSVYPLGGGSNILVPDEGVDGLVLKLSIGGIDIADEGDSALLVAGAGVSWDEVVDAALERGLSGIENLAGIPGSAGGAAVQNIGAYGAELSSVFAYADVLDAVTGEARRIAREDAGFGYRDSVFKKEPRLVILRVALRLPKQPSLNLAYGDLVRAKEEGVPLSTPREVATAVRAIRARKFPGKEDGGMAGSFFKNPVLAPEAADELARRFPELPRFPDAQGVKISLAWLLDRALGMKGYAQGGVRLFERQPIVVVAEPGTSAAAVDAFAREIEARVFAETGIRIEREVVTFGAQ